MALMLTGLVDHPAQARRILERLREAGWAPSDIAVVHPGESLPPAPVTDAPESPEAAPQAAVVGGGSAAVAAGAFGWLVGFGVMAIPAALVGAALGSAAGAAIGAGSDEETSHRAAALAHYGPRITGMHAAILVRAQDARGHDVVMRILRDEGAQDLMVHGQGRMEA